LDVLIYFSHSALIFEEALTTASVLLIEKPIDKVRRESVLIGYVHHAVEIPELYPLLTRQRPKGVSVLVQDLSTDKLLSAGKWDHLLNHVAEDLPAGFVPLSSLASTRRGIATGANSYFHISREDAKLAGIRSANLRNCVGRATDIPSLIFSQGDFKTLVADEGRTQLVVLGDDLSESEQAYVAKGEALGLPLRYLLAARSPWYSMERRKPSPIWAAVFGRRGLRFIHNSAGVSNLTTFHCI
jgi:adenine-specific DNA-methyltransferase